MKNISYLLLSMTFAVSVLASSNTIADEATAEKATTAQATQCLPFLDHKVRQLNSKNVVDLCELTAGKPVLVVNTASNCGYTPQFKGLQAVHEKYKDQGLVVVGFPSDNFFQEEDEEKDTAKVCYVNYGVTFTMLNTVEVRGGDAHPVFAYLGDKTTAPKWNFYKYVISADGTVVKHFNSRVSPEDESFVETLEAVL